MADERLPDDPDDSAAGDDPEADEEARWLRQREAERDRDRRLEREPKPEIELEKD
jgi:hypothetical protein